MGDLPAPKADDSRKRKAHKKSRQGCGNCKLRRVKCDEAKPQCQKCISYGVQCNYDGEASDELHLPGESAFSFTSKPCIGEPPRPEIMKDSMSPESDQEYLDSKLGMPIYLHDTDEMYHLTKEDIDVLYTFKNKTVMTIGTARSVHTYRKEISNMMISTEASYLTHIVLTLTLMHIRSANPWGTSPSSKESFHFFHGTAIFNSMLSQPIKEEDKDPLWGAAAILGAIAISSSEASKPEECWPLRPDQPDDLDWLRMSDGKKEVWRLTNPLRPGSVWSEVMQYDTLSDPTPYEYRVPELDLLYPFLIKIYDFDPSSSENTDDPYHTAASILVRLLELECNHANIMYFLSFIGHMDPRYRQLLHQKDPRALLLLAWWEGKMCQYGVWWQHRRMKLEGQAICMYLEKYHRDKEDIVRLLDFPKVMTGLD